MPQRKIIAGLIEDQRRELVRYAGAVSGDEAGAEDLVQEAWLRCDSAASTRPIDKPIHLIRRILRNVAIDRNRRITHESRNLDRWQSEHQWKSLLDDQPSVEDMLIARAELRAIEGVLGQLDRRSRQAFEMHRFEGAKLREIAERLGISVTTAHTLIANVMHKIRDAVRDD